MSLNSAALIYEGTHSKINYRKIVDPKALFYLDHDEISYLLKILCENSQILHLMSNSVNYLFWNNKKVLKYSILNYCIRALGLYNIVRKNKCRNWKWNCWISPCWSWTNIEKNCIWFWYFKNIHQSRINQKLNIFSQKDMRSTTRTKA